MIGSNDEFKVLILGDVGVGKTTLVSGYMSGFHSEELKLTIGVDCYIKHQEIEGQKIKLKIWIFYKIKISHF